MKRIQLQTLLRLQVAYGIAAIAYLVTSAVRTLLVGAPLSAAPPMSMIPVFCVYVACLALPRRFHVGWYRGAMLIWLALLGGGGVIGNIMRYIESGLEYYSSLSAFGIAVLLNAIGAVLNALATFGLFRSDIAQGKQ